MHFLLTSTIQTHCLWEGAHTHGRSRHRRKAAYEASGERSSTRDAHAALKSTDVVTCKPSPISLLRMRFRFACGGLHWLIYFGIVVRILANWKSAARSKERKSRHTKELELFRSFKLRQQHVLPNSH
ncbi:unnamed protein product [Sphenostylis stenocarpa]|uniref:Uncharacterized protein n=1 Tax=Sphenostylis stenocarpa TaxID=92480 RepID=A0AA86SRC8_9FABA|nr:unnamed protein product [Sphenostylis stenocarpa]